MTRAIVWKEFREQGLIGLTLILFGSAILVAIATFADPPSQSAGPGDVVRFLGAGLLATLMLAVTAGTVCGGALFAAEREAGTIGFLESLPVSRWHVWRAKLAAGVLLASAQIALVLLVGIATGLVDSLGWGFAIAVFSMLSFAWGVYGSTRARTTLGSVGVAVPAGMSAFILFFIPLWLIYPTRNMFILQPQGGVIFLVLMFVAPLLASALRFTRSDRERRAEDATPIRIAETASESAPHGFMEPRRRTRIGVQALLWLAWRQLLKPGLVIAAFAVVFGCSMLPETVHPILMWPGLALTAGVLAGVTLFMDEQGSGAARFWGERRLPVLRLWLVKVVVHAAFALGLAILLLIPSVVRAEVGGMPMLRGGSVLTFTMRSLLFDSYHLGGQGWNLLLLPLVYGFVAGHLCGLLFKKTVVAAGVAGVTGGSLAAFWLPSLASGGTHAWQLWLPPLAGLATAALLVRAWSSERMATRRPLKTLAAGLAIVLLTLGAGIGWRVLEVPDNPAGEDDIAYIASLPPLDVMDSGRQFRTAAERFIRVARTVPPFPKTPGPQHDAIDVRLSSVPYSGWNSGDPEMKDWMDQAYALDERGDPDERWFVQAAAAGRDPVDGIFEHPLRTGGTASLQTQANARRMGLILLAHGLQKQAEGNPTALIEDLRTALALGRTFRNGSVTGPLAHGNEVSRAAYSATDHWLDAYSGPSKPLRDVLELLVHDDAAPPFDPRPHLLAERHVMRELSKAPAQFLPLQITPPGKDPEPYSGIVDLVGTAWNVPWERERTRRLAGSGYEAGDHSPTFRSWVRGRPGSIIFLSRKQTPAEMILNDRHLRLHRRSLLLLVAIRIHQVEKGSHPLSLEDLRATGILRTLPLDPFGTEPFRYRISTGEKLTSSPATLVALGAKTPIGSEPLQIPPGQPVLWSRGVDGTDDGGRVLPSRPGIVRPGADIVFLPQMPE